MAKFINANNMAVRAFVRFLAILLLIIFCTPYTFFEEATAYLADTESELVHYYLTPLPDNGEACTDPPVLQPFIISFQAAEQIFPQYFPAPVSLFFHPPQ